MKTSKIIEAAKKAKEDGYEYMTSVVKSVYNTTYCNVNKIDDILAAGKWIPARYVSMMPTADGSSTWHGRMGQNWVPKNSINKSSAILKYCK